MGNLGHMERPLVAGALLIAILVAYVVALVLHLRSERWIKKEPLVFTVATLNGRTHHYEAVRPTQGLPPVPARRLPRHAAPPTEVIPAQRRPPTRAIPPSVRL